MKAFILALFLNVLSATIATGSLQRCKAVVANANYDAIKNDCNFAAGSQLTWMCFTNWWKYTMKLTAG